MAASTVHWQPSLINWLEVSPLRWQGITLQFNTYSFQGWLPWSQVLDLILHSVLYTVYASHAILVIFFYTPFLYISMSLSMPFRLHMMGFANCKIPINPLKHAQGAGSLHRFPSPFGAANCLHHTLFTTYYGTRHSGNFLFTCLCVSLHWTMVSSEVQR